MRWGPETMKWRRLQFNRFDASEELAQGSDYPIEPIEKRQHQPSPEGNVDPDHRYRICQQGRSDFSRQMHSISTSIGQ